MFLHLLGAHRQQTLASLHDQGHNAGSVDGVGGQPANAVWSDVFGYVSFGCWLLVLLPQLWLNYRRKSSDGLSLGFILMWLAGDFADWFGAYVGRLLLPAILIALYFVFTDIVLLAQMSCYRKSDDDIFGVGQLPEGAERPPLLMRRGRRACRLSGPDSTKQRLEEYHEAEREALLDRGFEEHQIYRGYGALPASTSSRSSTAPARSSCASATQQALQSIRELGSAETGRAVAISVVALVALLGVGVGARAALAFYPPRVTVIVSQVFGYLSAALFFIAYIPQIAWNFTAESTEGLSPLMFCFTVLGNITYCLSILAMSTERDYLIAYAPWLAGAAGTLGFEAVILWQCYFYAKPRFGSRRSSSASSASLVNNSEENDDDDGEDDDDGSNGVPEDSRSIVSRPRRSRRRWRRTRRPTSAGTSVSRSRVRSPGPGDIQI
ncbi:hypothetical protein GGF46_003965 [Coemansia sp. RSA 552]|nr:hypothetical protein GGF46_003965 [Coemansia sp. RSA 552]